MHQISRLQYITTSPELAEQACLGGVRWVQLRLKDITDTDYLSVGREVLAVCREFGATFILNDRPDLALQLHTDGVHVGKEDKLPPHEQSALLKQGKIIGCTANTLDDVRHLQGKPVSYIGYGPYRFTTTKQKLSPVLGAEGYRSLLEATSGDLLRVPPIIAIGGITVADVPLLMQTGIWGIAVSGAISQAGDPEESAAAFVAALERAYN